jgi:Trk K+ transport system NAD-binding subunit
MGNPLLVVLQRLLTGQQEQEKDRAQSQDLPQGPGRQASTGILLVLRRMRAPLIALIVIFAVSVLGLSLIPGEDAQGEPVRLTLFESLYFMSYTATTIGFGEIPYTFTPAQRMWVTFVIFLSVIGWAYAVGSLLALLQDRSFRRALARGHYGRKVSHLGEPFLVIVGYGNAAKRLARSLDEIGHRFVVVDREENRVAAVDLDSYHADTPALLADARDTSKMVLAGLGNPRCEGVLALTGDDETNLDVTMTTRLLRPDLPVIARTSSREIAERMQLFGAAQVVNPLDRFGDHLRILLRSPASYQLMVWLTSTAGTPLPPRREALPRGRWVVCGYGRFGRELTDDLRAEGLEVSVVAGEGEYDDRPDERDGGQIDHGQLATAGLGDAAGIVAATENDMTNLWLVEEARRANPDAFLVALQNRATNGSLFRALEVDFSMVPAEVIAHEVMARLATPLLMRFLPGVPRQGEQWAAETVDRLVERCGRRTPLLWHVTLDEASAPGLATMLARGDDLRLGDLFRSPQGRDHPLEAIPLLLLRDGDAQLTPADDELVHSGDELLVAGSRSGQRGLRRTLDDEVTATYVVEGRHVPSSWLWRRLSRSGAD